MSESTLKSNAADVKLDTTSVARRMLHLLRNWSMSDATNVITQAMHVLVHNFNEEE